MLDKASDENERNYYKIKCAKSGEEIIIVQIAGLIARRIIGFIKEGDEINAGERFGLIRFGSRVDVYLPEGSQSDVKVGNKVKAGETIIGSL